MPQKPFKTTVSGQDLLVNPILKGWIISKRQSSYVAYIAVNEELDSLFFQFNNGTCFMYKDVTADLIHRAVGSESIGKFFHAEIKGKYEGEAMESHCIELDEGLDESEGNDQYNPLDHNFDEGFDSFEDDDEFE